jgi:hypothetical protein
MVNRSAAASSAPTQATPARRRPAVAARCSCDRVANCRRLASGMCCGDDRAVTRIQPSRSLYCIEHSVNTAIAYAANMNAKQSGTEPDGSIDLSTGSDAVPGWMPLHETAIRARHNRNRAHRCAASHIVN